MYFKLEIVQEISSGIPIFNIIYVSNILTNTSIILKSLPFVNKVFLHLGMILYIEYLFYFFSLSDQEIKNTNWVITQLVRKLTWCTWRFAFLWTSSPSSNAQYVLARTDDRMQFKKAFLCILLVLVLLLQTFCRCKD